MNEPCRHESHVRRAASQDQWTAALREHIAHCADCRAAAAVAPVMTAIAGLDDRAHPLPAPAVIWLQAQLLRGHRTVDLVSRPLNIMQVVAYTAVAAGWAAVAMWKLDDVQRLAASLTPAAIVSGGPGLSIGLLAAVVVLGSMTFALAMHTVLAED